MATKLTKLAAVNVVLSNVGQAPVTTIDNDNPMVVMAANVLDEVTNSVQSEGWTYNTERAYPFTPDTSKKINIPKNILQIDTPRTSRLDVVIREGKLYDKRENTYNFDDKVEATVVWLVEFDDMPEAFKQYVTMRAANLYAGRAVGSSEAVKFGEREEAQARAAMLEYETEQGDYSFLGTEENLNIPSYRPFDAVYRF